MPLTRNQSNAASQAKVAAANNSETSTSKESNDQAGTSTEAEPPRRDSPENCSICLGPFNNKSFTSSCAHSFCFVCLKQWSKVKAECPLCKQPFTSIFHNIRSNQHYDIYELPHQPSNPVDYSIFNYVSGPIPSFTAPTHHLFSLSQPAFDADLTLSNFSRFQFRHRRYDRYLNPLTIHGEHPYSFSGPSVNPASHVSAATWPRGAEEFRRDVYRRNLGPPAVILGCENSTYRLTPAMVVASAHRIHRIMPWLTRELKVLLRSHQNVRLAISIIQPLLTQVTIDSMYFYDRVAPLIGRRARQFVQEFVAFANSALSVQAYDRKAMYRRRDVVSAVPSSSSSTSSENDVVEVTDISPDIYPSGASANPGAPGPSQTQPLNLSRTGWDSPTLGPSWNSSNLGPSWDSTNATQDSVIDRVSVSSESDDPVYRPDLRNSDSERSKAGSDIIFVKYDKPWNERSPINLTSDSDAGEGNERRKKKSKHKKKKKESGDNGEASGSKKDKVKKSSSKSKHKDKSKSTSKTVVSDEERESAGVSKRRHSQSSTEHHKVKKHKRSKSKKEKLSDREIVDRYFAQAISQDKEEKASEAEDQEVTTSSRQKERSSSKEKSRKRKKSRKHSKDSYNQSNRHTFKKHHSGHKKSSNRLADGLPEQHSRHNRPHSPGRQNQAGGPSRTDSMGNENMSQHEASSSTISHSVVPGFQTPYISMTDTVQHIPVNLWVSAWPALSVSHTYPPPPPPIAMGQGIPHNSNTSSSTVTSNANGTGEPNRTHLDRLSISSDSSTDSSDSESDDAQDLQIPSLQNVHSRTKQWLETNFPDLGRPQTTSTSVPGKCVTTTSSSASGNATTSAVVVDSTASGTQNPLGKPESGIESNGTSKDREDDVIEVLSIASGDDDVVVCSSDDTDSNAGDLWVIGVDNSNKKANKISKNSSCSNFKGDYSGSTHVSTLPFSTSNHPESSGEPASGPNNIILPPVNKSFHPFKLQKKPAMAICGKDPFFPSMTHSSDEDGEVDNILQSTSSTSQPFVNESVQSQSSVASSTNKLNEISHIDNLEDMPHPALAPVASLTSILDMKEPIHTSPVLSSESFNPSNQIQETQIIPSTSLSTTSITTATCSSVFSTLPPLTSSSHSTKPSSGISYLPYANLPPPTSVSSIVPPFPSQASIPPPPPPSISLSLPYHPFTQIPILSTTAQSNNHLLPSMYPSPSQVISATSSQYLTNGNSLNDSPAQSTTVNETNKERLLPQSYQDTNSGFADSSNYNDGNCAGSDKETFVHHDCLDEAMIQQGSKCKQTATSSNDDGGETALHFDNSTPIVNNQTNCSNEPYHHPVSVSENNSLEQNGQKEFVAIESLSVARYSSPQDEILESVINNESSLPQSNVAAYHVSGQMEDNGKSHDSCLLPISSISCQDVLPNTDQSSSGLDKTFSVGVKAGDPLTHPESDDKPFDAFFNMGNDCLSPPNPISFQNQDIGGKTLDALDKSSGDSVLPKDTVSHVESIDKPFDTLLKRYDDCVLPTDTLSQEEGGDKPLEVNDKSSDDNKNVLSHENTTDKPFDVLEDCSMSNNGRLLNTFHSSVSLHSQQAAPITTTSSSEGIEQPVIGSNLQPSSDHSPDAQPVSCSPYNNLERTDFDLSNVFKLYSSPSDRPLHPFTDALASSDSDSDK